MSWKNTCTTAHLQKDSIRKGGKEASVSITITANQGEEKRESLAGPNLKLYYLAEGLIWIVDWMENSKAKKN